MLKLIVVAFTATVLWMSASQAQVTGGRVRCESNHDSLTECETGVTIANPAVLQEYSDEVCVFGSTWGFYGSKIWVHHNCRAEFSYDAAGGVDPVPTPTPTPKPTPRPPAYKVVDCRWNAQNWQPFYKPLARFIGRVGFGFVDSNTCVYTVQKSVAGAVCNWTGNGFTPYDMETNVEVNYISYPTIETCYDSVR